MKAKFEDMKKQLLEKDKWIVELGKTSEKSSKAVGEVKGSLEKTYQVKIKSSPASHQDLQSQLNEKELEVKVLNQMIVSANKMVQVKTTEYNRLASKFNARNSLPFIKEASDEFSVDSP